MGVVSRLKLILPKIRSWRFALTFEWYSGRQKMEGIKIVEVVLSDLLYAIFDGKYH